MAQVIIELDEYNRLLEKKKKFDEAQKIINTNTETHFNSMSGRPEKVMSYNAIEKIIDIFGG